MEPHNNGSTGSSGSLVMEANYGGAATAITCTYFLVHQEDDHYRPISSGLKDEEPLFNMTLAAVGLASGVILNSLLLVLVLLRRCNESISFTFILLAWLAFVDLLASSLTFISQLTHVPDHDQHTFQFQGTLVLWSLSTAALGPLMLTTILAFHNLFPLTNEAVNASCYIQTSTVAALLLGGWIFPLFSAFYPESGLFFAFCVIALTAISFSVIGVVAVLGVMVSQQRTHQADYKGALERSVQRLQHNSGVGVDGLLLTGGRMTCTLRDGSLPTQVLPTAIDSRSREATFTVCLGVLGNGLCWLPLVVDSLVRQTQATHILSTLLSRCSVQPMFLQLATVPFLLRPLFFLICSDEMNSLCHWCARKIDLRRAREDSSFWESPFANSQSPHMSRSLVVDQDSLLINSNSGATTSGGYYRRTSGQSASKQQRSVGFHNVEDYRPTSQHRAGGGSFFPDIFMVSKRTNTGGGGGQPHHPRKKNGRYWKRYSCSSCSEPMSLFTSSSTTSINHVHNLGSAPLPNAVYKREMIKRRSSAFKGSSTISSSATHDSAYSTCRQEPSATINQSSFIPKQILLPQDTVRRSSF